MPGSDRAEGAAGKGSGELHPDAARYLRKLEESGLPRFSNATLGGIRTRFVQSSAKLYGEHAGAETVDHSIAGPDGPIAIRVYRPGGGRSRPTLLFFHGGGFVMGSLESHDGLCHDLAARLELTVVSVAYRLAPEDPYPAPRRDAEAALEWLYTEDASAIGVSAERLALGGDSVGGLLALWAGGRAAELGRRIELQVLIYPALDLTASLPSHQQFSSGFGLDRDQVEFCYQSFLQGRDPSDPAISALHGPPRPEMPPTVLALAGCDPLRDEGLAFAERLRAAGHEATVLLFDGLIHGSLSLCRILPAAREARDDLLATLRGRLDGQTMPAVEARPRPLRKGGNAR